MRIAITTPSGHVGSAVTHFVLEAGAGVRLLARRPEKLRDFANRGAKVVRGSQDDSEYVTWMTHDVDALLWVTPPGYGSDDLRAYQNRLGMVAAEAIRANQIPRVVNLSSIGANLYSGVGPIGGLHDVEGLLTDACENIVHLRPGFFFENFLWHIEEIRDHGLIRMPLSGSTRYPMLATRDIARVAADCLLDEKWKGREIRELHGPEDLSLHEAAAAISVGLQRKVEFQKIDREEARREMLDVGMSENAADLMLEMYEAVETGRLRPTQLRSPQTTTPTTLTEFAREVLTPMIAEYAHP